MEKSGRGSRSRSFRFVWQLGFIYLPRPSGAFSLLDKPPFIQTCAGKRLARYFFSKVMTGTIRTGRPQDIFRVLLGAFMCLAAIGHLSFQRTAFQAQVPDWLPLDKDLVVILSGIIELAPSMGMIFWKRQRVKKWAPRSRFSMCWSSPAILPSTKTTSVHLASIQIGRGY